MRISDWSSDVCSSDLEELHLHVPHCDVDHGRFLVGIAGLDADLVGALLARAVGHHGVDLAAGGVVPFGLGGLAGYEADGLAALFVLEGAPVREVAQALDRLRSRAGARRTKGGGGGGGCGAEA